MSGSVNLGSLEEARQYVRRAMCGGCQISGTLGAYQVQKEGPNQGRLFAKCRHCGHFDWLSAATGSDTELDRVQKAAGPCPRCGKERHARRVGKEGPNRGRLFLVCADPSCN